MKKILLAVLITAVAAASLSADIIMLKDGQEFSGDVAGFDDFYINVTVTGDAVISIPWQEIMAIKHTTTGQSWLEAEKITAEDYEVSTLVVPLSKDTALMKSLFPGIALHGSGHFYGRDKNTGMSLLSAEIVALIMMGLSAAEIIQPEAGSQASMVSQIVFYTGLTVFGGSWLYDVIFSGAAVDKFNGENSFLLQETR